MALTKVTGQVINDSTGLVVGVTTVGGGLSATDGFFSGIVTAVGDASFSGNVSVGGTLTYEDVTNIDAVGLVTARNGIVVGSGITLSKDGDVFFTGIATGNGSGLTNLPAANITGTLPAISGANLTNLTAGNLTGALPAISGANLTGIAATDNVRTGILDVAGISTFRNTVNIGAAVTISESGIEVTGVGITVANINGGQIGGRRNIVINGAMNVSQRGTSFTPGNTTSDSVYTLDRMQASNNHDGALTITQSSTAPDGFRNSLKVDVTTADTSLASGQYAQILYKVEAQDLQQLAFGTSSAKDCVLSFYVRSNKTGNYGVAVLQNDNTNKQATFQYTINSADTWERKAFLIPGDTSGVINDDTGRGFDIHIGLASGTQYTDGSLRSSFTSFNDGDLYAGQSVNLLDSTSNEWYITGLQLEAGSQLTSYEHRSYAEELQHCMRYYERQSVSDGNGGYATVAMGHRVSNTRVIIQPNFRVIKRATNATFEFNGPMRILYQNNGAEQTISSWSAVQNRQFGLHGGYKVLDQSSGVGGSNGYTFRLEGNGDTGAYIAFDSEL